MILIVIALIGLCLGSFVNALVWRLRQQRLPQVEKAKVHKSKSNERSTVKNDYSILSGRSMCPDCRHVLAAKDLVPIVSWLILRGKCRYCHKPISWQYPLVELIGAVLFVVSYLAWPLSLQGAGGTAALTIWLTACVLLLALAVYDARWRELPSQLIYILLPLSIAFWALQVGVTGWRIGDVWNELAAQLLLGGVFYAIFRLSKERFIGFGDVRLALALAFFAYTPQRALLLLFIASLGGTLASLPQLMRRKKSMRSTLPFGPYLIIAAAIVVLVGNRILELVDSWLFPVV